jgi:hypothetical protein
MIFTRDDFPDGPPEEVILMLSGGLDSAILFYLICKHFPKTYIVPFSGDDACNPADILCAQDILKFMRKRFPNTNIGKHEIYSFNTNDTFWFEKAKDQFNNFTFSSIEGLSKHFQLVKGLKKVREQTNILTFVNAVTANPPNEEMNLHGLEHGADQYRNDYIKSRLSKTVYRNILYKPWINTNKRDIAQIYKQENLIESLYKLTKSCVDSTATYENRECGSCWWCREKKWGFE